MMLKYFQNSHPFEGVENAEFLNMKGLIQNRWHLVRFLKCGLLCVVDVIRNSTKQRFEKMKRFVSVFGILSDISSLLNLPRSSILSSNNVLANALRYMMGNPTLIQLNFVMN